MCQNPDFRCMESLYACLTTVRSFFDNFLAADPAAYVAFTTFTFFRLTHVSQVLYRLSTLQDSAWSRSIVIGIIDINEIGGKIAENLSRVAAASGLVCDGPEDPFTRMATLYRIATRNWELIMREPEVQTASDAQLARIHGEMAQVEEMLDLPQELWLMDMFAT